MKIRSLSGAFLTWLVTTISIFEPKRLSVSVMKGWAEQFKSAKTFNVLSVSQKDNKYLVEKAGTEAIRVLCVKHKIAVGLLVDA